MTIATKNKKVHKKKTTSKKDYYNQSVIEPAKRLAALLDRIEKEEKINNPQFPKTASQ